MQLATLALVMFSAGHPDAQAAFQDQRGNSNYVYLSLRESTEPQKLINVLRFVIPSLSHKSYLGDQLPELVCDGKLLRLDVQGLGWEKVWSNVIRQHYVPLYRQDLKRSGQVPIVISGSWFAASIVDPVLTGDAQYQLLYGGAVPKNDAQFQAFWQVNNKSDLFFGRIEGESGVAVQKTRLMENRPTGNRGYSWITFDSKTIAGATDPLENLTKRSNIKHDASETIAAIPKHYGGRAGALQAYFLSDAKGARQEKAPADIVVDHTAIRGVEIRNTISCIACHVEGLRLPTVDEYKAYVTSGAEVKFLKKDDQREVDRFYDSPIAKELQRNNEDYAEGVALCNDLTPQENAAQFKTIVQLYDAPLTLEQAARELYCKVDELKFAIADYGTTTGRLAYNQTISREQWAQNYYFAQQILYKWQYQFNEALK
jgi:hypothetical protein